MVQSLPVAVETSPKRSFAWALDWPGWCRSGGDVDLALDALVNATPRYAEVAERAGLAVPDVGPAGLEIVESVDGDSGTAFGVPTAITSRDRRAMSAGEAERLAALVEASWAAFDRVAVASPAGLRKGPRGGGRDRDTMIVHVIDSDHVYARQIGVRLPAGSLADRAAVTLERTAMLEVLRRPTDGSPLGGGRWPARYAARRIAWHALDHAWEMEDRSIPG
ncbi:MAG: hypothetical protein OEV61_00760 [Chloroflexota bacterium]|nr:hypothetical protein [Chloroflexota bacterium]MDH5242474.1 hypothetical protein [Chloroflexota bacterium]